MSLAVIFSRDQRVLVDDSEKANFSEFRQVECQLFFITYPRLPGILSPFSSYDYKGVVSRLFYSIDYRQYYR